MALKKIEKYIDLLLFLYANKKVDVGTIEKKFGMKYITVNKLFKIWMQEGLIEREKIIGTHGGYSYQYYLNEKGIKFLKERASKIIKTLELSKEGSQDSLKKKNFNESKH